MHVRMRLHPAPPPLLLHCRRPALRIPPWKTRHCSWGCRGRSSFSIIPSSFSASSKASISHKHPSISELHTPPLSQILKHPFFTPDSSQAVTSRANSPCCIPLFPSAWLDSPPQQSPSPVLLTVIYSPKHRLRKKQASCLFFLHKCLSAGQLVFRCPFGG